MNTEKIEYIYEEKHYNIEQSEYKALSALEATQYGVEDPILSKQEPENFSLVEKGRDKDKGEWIKSKFVGFLFCNDEIYISLPKYLENDKKEPEETEVEKARNFRVYQDLRRLLYKFRDPFTEWLRDPSNFEDMTREVRAAQKLGDLYQRNGLYTVSRSRYNTVSGRVLWGRTVAKHSPDLYNGAPIYPRLERRTRNSEENEISEVQKALLYYLFEERRYNLVLPGYPVMMKSRLSWEYIKEKSDHYLPLLREERLMVFDDDSVELLDTILELLSDTHASREKKNDYRVYGIARFWYLFEKMLGECLENQIEIKKGNEDNKTTKVLLKSKLLPGEPINDINEKMIWRYNKKKKEDKHFSVPDIVYELPDKNICMLIDAKYYRIKDNSNSDNKSSDNMSGFPPYDDVIKQIRYKMLLENLYKRELKEADGIQPPVIYNIFLLPDGTEEYDGTEEQKDLFTQPDSLPFRVDYLGEKILLIYVNMTRLIQETLEKKTPREDFKNELYRIAVKANEAARESGK